MQATDGSLIVIELVLVFGGALAFGWWQLRDIERDRQAAVQRRQQPADPAAAEQELDKPERTDGEPGH